MTEDDKTALFLQMKKMLKLYEKGTLIPRHDDDRYYDLWSEQRVIIADRPRKEVFFAAVIMQKDYVGFYFMPVYSDTDILEFFPQELLACKKGASCFHIRKWDERILKQMEEVLLHGYRLYEARGWIVS